MPASISGGVYKGKKFYGTPVGYTVTQKKKLMNADITKSQFKKEVLESPDLSLVHFKKEWNGACQIIAPIFEDLTKSYKSVVKFFTVDIDKQKIIASEFGISETPSILFFKKGEIIDHSIGLISKNELIAKIENALIKNKN